MDSTRLINMLVDKNLVSSMSEARRLIVQGAIKVDGEVTTDLDREVSFWENTISVGKHVYGLHIGYILDKGEDEC